MFREKYVTLHPDEKMIILKANENNHYLRRTAH